MGAIAERNPAPPFHRRTVPPHRFVMTAPSTASQTAANVERVQRQHVAFLARRDQWQRRLGAHRELVVAVYEAVLLARRPRVAAGALAVHVAALWLLTRGQWSAVSLGATLFLLWSTVEYAWRVGVLRSVHMASLAVAIERRVVGELLAVTATAATPTSSVTSPLGLVLRRPPLTFDALCETAATVETRACMWIERIVDLHEQSPHGYMLVVLSAYLAVTVLLSLVGDLVLVFACALAPVLWPFIHHYDLVAVTMGYARPPVDHAMAVTVRSLDRARGSFLAPLWSAVVDPVAHAAYRVVDVYREAVRVPEEFLSPTPAPGSLDSLSGVDPTKDTDAMTRSPSSASSSRWFTRWAGSVDSAGTSAVTDSLRSLIPGTPDAGPGTPPPRPLGGTSIAASLLSPASWIHGLVGSSDSSDADTSPTTRRQLDARRKKMDNDNEAPPYAVPVDERGFSAEGGALKGSTSALRQRSSTTKLQVKEPEYDFAETSSGASGGGDEK